MKKLVQRPAAAAIVGSLRSIGYSFNTAIADIIDNSISANASQIMIGLERREELPILTILDDGDGMEESELIEAMRHGGRGGEGSRSGDDLGRFGLGLKTASLSQCRRLTVATITSRGAFAAARWDLDEVERRNDWVLLLPGKSEIGKLSAVSELRRVGRGTVVIWECFDLALSGATDKTAFVESLVDDARPHLALVFQRFLPGGDSNRQLSLTVNGLALAGIDPFLSSNPKTQQLPTEEVKIGSSRVRITGFILPQLKNIDAADILKLGGPNGIRLGQGFYVYRNKRLIIAGTWFRMLRLDELTKLARVRIDIPNTMDALWNLDVKKSVATPPEPVRRVLKRIIDRIANQSLAMFRERSPATKTRMLVAVWLRREHGAQISYRVNRDHPVIAELLDDGSRTRSHAAERAIKLIELSLPYPAIFADMSGNAGLEPTSAQLEGTLRDLLSDWISQCGDDIEMRRSIIRVLPSLDPFSRYPELTRALAEAYADGN